MPVPEGAVAIDIGCGTGKDLVLMAEFGLRVIGLDVSPTAVALAREHARSLRRHVDVLAGDVLDLPLIARSADLVTDRGCLHYLPEEVRPRYASELARVLRVGGFALIRGMSEGSKKHVVTPESVRRSFCEPHFRIRSILSFDMVGLRGHRPATLALLGRQP